MASWQVQVLRATLKSLCATGAPSTRETASQGATPLAIANHLLQQSVPPSVLAAFDSISPKASRAAFAELEECAKHIMRADLVDEKGEPLSHPPLLKRLAAVFVERWTGHILVRVGAAKGDAGYVVLVRDLRFPSALARVVVTDDDTGDMAEVHCACKAFAFRAAGELLCKHAIIAIVAASANLAPRAVLSEEGFVDMLEVGT